MSHSSLDASNSSKPQYRNLNIFNDVRKYRLPVAGIVSILHRISGFIMFLLLPGIVWLFEHSVASFGSFEQFKAVFNHSSYGAVIKIVVLVLIWAYLHHFCAGLRYLVMDLYHGAVDKKIGKKTAIATLIISLVLTFVLGAKLFGLY